jgi:HlyD family secretion protein
MELLKRRKWILIGIAAILLIAAAVTAMNSGVAAEVVSVDRGEVAKILKETGTVESESTVTVTAKNSGEVKGLTVKEGDSVKTGDILMAGSGAGAALDIKSLQAELSGLQIQYNQARDLAGKNKSLYDQGALSYEEYNATDTAARQLSAQITSLRYSIGSYAESSGAEGVIAPVDGVLTGVFVKEGESVSPGTPLFEISNLDDVYVKTDFIAEDADLIRKGDPVRLYNEDTGFSDEKAAVRKIHLKAEDKVSDLGVSQKRVTVEISFGTSETVRLGSDVDVEITVEKRGNVLRISDLAVFEKEMKDCVYVVEGGKAALREIETGLEGEDYIEVSSGLSPGEVVILSPGDEIEAGVKVKAQTVQE